MPVFLDPHHRLLHHNRIRHHTMENGRHQRGRRQETGTDRGSDRNENHRDLQARRTRPREEREVEINRGKDGVKVGRKR